MATQRSSGITSNLTGESLEDPVFISLGKAKKKTIKRMKKGKGRLIDEIYATVEEYKKDLAADGKTALVPLVFIVREKREKAGGIFG